MSLGWVVGFPNHWASGGFEFEEPGHPFWFLLSEEGAHGLARSSSSSMAVGKEEEEESRDRRRPDSLQQRADPVLTPL